MKNIFLILSSLFLISCSKSTYYAYEYRDEINHHYSYCTLELTRKQEIIYRGRSDKYYEYPNKNLYIYIYSDKYASEINEKYISFARNYSNLFYIRDILNPTYNATAINIFGESPKFIEYAKIKADSITHSNNENFLEYAKKEYGLYMAGIKWFPPYMVKVDKIDYTKFGKEIQHLNLKNPRKEK